MGGVSGRQNRVAAREGRGGREMGRGEGAGVAERAAADGRAAAGGARRREARLLGWRLSGLACQPRPRRDPAAARPPAARVGAAPAGRLLLPLLLHAPSSRPQQLLPAPAPRVAACTAASSTAPATSSGLPLPAGWPAAMSMLVLQAPPAAAACTPLPCSRRALHTRAANAASSGRQQRRRSAAPRARAHRRWRTRPAGRGWPRRPPCCAR